MITYFDASNNAVPLSDYERLHIIHKQDGNDTCSFLLDTTHPAYKEIHEETVIRAGGNEWLVKKIDDDKFDCELNFDFLKNRFYLDYTSETRSLSEVLEQHLPSGWTVEGATVSTIRRTITFDLCTDYDVIMECLDVYDVKFVWHILDHSVTVVKLSMMNPTGEYVTSELNLKSLSFRGQSTDFATRIYAYGYDGMTMEEAIVEGEPYGLTYIDSREYRDKTVVAYWKDERYTNPTNLYEAAKEKLSSMSFPVRSYECSIVDLAKQDDKYSFLDFTLHKVISLIDIDRGISVAHQIVEYDEYPDEPDLNVVTLSSVVETIQRKIRANTGSGGTEAAERVRAELIAFVNEKDAQQTSHADQIGENMTNRLNMATAMLMASFGTYQHEANGSLFFMDNPDPALATVVWRFNINGFGKSSTGIDGPYTTALTVDDTFLTNIVEAMIIRGSFIEAGSISADKISQSYSNEVLSQAFTSAQGLTEALFSQISAYLEDPDTGKLTVINQTLADLRATIEGLDINFKDQYRGGINHIFNSSGLNGLSDDWDYTSGVVTLQSSDTKNATVANSCFRIPVDGSLSQTIDNLIPGNNYTITCKVKKEGSLLSRVYVVYNGSTEGVLFSSSQASGWAEYTFSIEGVQSNTLQFVCETRCDYLYVADVILTEGLLKQSWTPAPDEIYTSGVKIDKNGIEVYRSESEERTVITNREFAGYYQEEEIFSLNRDETRIGKAIVRGELNIDGTVFIPFEANGEKGLNIAIID